MSEESDDGISMSVTATSLVTLGVVPDLWNVFACMVFVFLNLQSIVCHTSYNFGIQAICIFQTVKFPDSCSPILTVLCWNGNGVVFSFLQTAEARRVMLRKNGEIQVRI